MDPFSPPPYKRDIFSRMEVCLVHRQTWWITHKNNRRMIIVNVWRLVVTRIRVQTPISLRSLMMQFIFWCANERSCSNIQWKSTNNTHLNIIELLLFFNLKIIHWMVKFSNNIDFRKLDFLSEEKVFSLLFNDFQSMLLQELIFK